MSDDLSDPDSVSPVYRSDDHDREGDRGPIRSVVARTLRIARWEVQTSTGTIDRGTMIAFGIALLLFLLATPALLSGGVALDEDIYRVAIDDDHEYYPAVEADTALRPVEDRESADLVVTENGLTPDDSPKGQAALAQLRSAIEVYNNRRLRAERNQSAAFPVVVELTHESRSLDRGTVGGPPGSGGGTADGDGTAGEDDGSGVDPPGDADGRTGVDDGTSDGGTTGDDTNGGGDGDGTTGGSDGDGTAGDGDGGGGTDGPGGDEDDPPTGTAGDDDSRFDIGPNGLFEDDQVGTPADIDPPFPFEPLILAFLFIIPMNFVIQAYGSTIINERLNRRGELLLVAPISPAEIVAGKTLPYFGALVGTTAAIAVALRLLSGASGGLLSVLAVVPLAMVFLAATFVAGMFARSFKELTFLTVTISVFLTTYAFVPAIFTDVTPIALISPLTLVVRDFQGVGATVVQYAFSTGPVYLSSLVLFGIGLGVYREEDMFTQRAVHRKAIDALAAHLHRPGHVFVMTALLIPFVFLLQLLSIAVLFPLPLEIGFVVVVVFAAAIEEVAKSIHVYAAYEHERFERTVPVALLLGLLSGAGFFVAEKAVHVGQLVGLDDVELGRAVFQIGLEVGPVLTVLVLLAPLVLHVVTAVISILGARSNAVRYVIAVGIATVVHVCYNLGVLLYVA